jgi:hypothetical protein
MVNLTKVLKEMEMGTLVTFIRVLNKTKDNKCQMTPLSNTIKSISQRVMVTKITIIKIRVTIIRTTETMGRRIMAGGELKVVSGTRVTKVKKNKILVKGLCPGKNSKHSTRARNRNINRHLCNMDLDFQSR